MCAGRRSSAADRDVGGGLAGDVGVEHLVLGVGACMNEYASFDRIAERLSLANPTVSRHILLVLFVFLLWMLVVVLVGPIDQAAVESGRLPTEIRCRGRLCQVDALLLIFVLQTDSKIKRARR